MAAAQAKDPLDVLQSMFMEAVGIIEQHIQKSSR